MLCITRRDNQDTLLRLPDGREILVRIVWSRHGRAMLGIDAPPDVHIARAELPDGRFMRRATKTPS